MISNTLLVSLIALTVFDIHTTSEILKHGGYEQNGILARLFAWAFKRWQHAGRFWSLVAIKGVFLGGMIYAHTLYRSTQVWQWAMVAIVAGYCWVAWHNWKAYKEIK